VTSMISVTFLVGGCVYIAEPRRSAKEKLRARIPWLGSPVYTWYHDNQHQVSTQKVRGSRDNCITCGQQFLVLEFSRKVASVISDFPVYRRRYIEIACESTHCSAK
jgi:hypothetical protein